MGHRFVVSNYIFLTLKIIVILTVQSDDMLCLICVKFDDVTIHSFRIVKGFISLFTLLNRSAILSLC